MSLDYVVCLWWVLNAHDQFHKGIDFIYKLIAGNYKNKKMARLARLLRTSLCFARWASLRLFKFVPDKFVELCEFKTSNKHNLLSGLLQQT